MSKDMSFIALSPHMHLIGRNYRVWFETTDGDSVPMIDIPDWNFHWQMFYQFQYVQKVPEGARIHGEAFYDNTTNNPYNPNNPPITVKQGPYTTDEMLMTFMAYTEYQPGDEDILLDSSLIATNIETSASEILPVSVYPNPTSNLLFLQAHLTTSSLQLELLNGLGMVVKEFPCNESASRHIYKTDQPRGINSRSLLPQHQVGRPIGSAEGGEDELIALTITTPYLVDRTDCTSAVFPK
jgi:hypothetical protein